LTQQTIWQWLADALAHREAVMLMIVVSSTGSSPGKAGAKMAVTIRGEHYGTIGGGAVEYAMVKHALAHRVHLDERVDERAREQPHVRLHPEGDGSFVT